MKILSALFLATVLATAAHAQQFASVAGEVKDLQTGKPVRGFVLLYNDSTLQGAAYADSLGRFKIEHVPYGMYSIQVKRAGYRVQVTSAVQVAQRYTRVGELALNRVPHGLFGAVLWSKRRRVASMYY